MPLGAADTGNQLDVGAGLDQLADNGGATWTMALLPGSPAIDAGDPAGCRDAVGAPLFTDQRGLPRPNACGGGWRCDIGAFEMQCASDFRRLYESPAASAVITPANDRGLLLSSPHEHRPPTAAAILYYQADDGAGSPARIDLVRSDDGIRIFF